MADQKIRILYIHGFNSSPASAKARLFSRYCDERGIALSVPELSYDPAKAMAMLEAIVKEWGEVNLLVGSSLGGYYATYLSEKYNLKAALVNPAVSPYKHLSEEFLGKQTNYYTGESYELGLEHVDSLKKLDVDPVIRPDNFLLLVQTGDEVLDYRLAVEKYQGASQIIQPGGDHSFNGFESVIPEIMGFAGLDALSGQPRGGRS